MKKFIIMIDYKAGTGKVFDYIPVTAHDIVEYKFFEEEEKE